MDSDNTDWGQEDTGQNGVSTNSGSTTGYRGTCWGFSTTNRLYLQTSASKSFIRWATDDELTTFGNTNFEELPWLCGHNDGAIEELTITDLSAFNLAAEPEDANITTFSQAEEKAQEVDGGHRHSRRGGGYWRRVTTAWNLHSWNCAASPQRPRGAGGHQEEPPAAAQTAGSGSVQGRGVGIQTLNKNKKGLRTVKVFNSVNSKKLMYACVFLFTFLLAIPYTSASDLTPTQNPEAKLVIFDEIGTLLSTTAFIHVTIPLNLTQLQVQATSIMLYLNQIRHTNSSIADDLPKFKKNLDDICFNAAKKLNRVMGKIRLLDSILPADTENFRSFMDMQELKLKRQQQQQQQQQQPLHPTLHKRRRKRLTKNERPYVPDWRLFDTLRDIIMDSNELLIKPIKRTRQKRLIFMGLYIDAELKRQQLAIDKSNFCLLYTSPSPRD